MLFSQKLPYQFNPFESELLNLATHIIRSVTPESDPDKCLRRKAENAYIGLMQTDSDEGDGHIRLLRSTATLRSEFSDYLVNTSDLRRRSFEISPSARAVNNYSAAMFIDLVSRSRQSILLKRSQPAVFSGKGGWGDSAEIIISPEGPREFCISFSENNSNCAFAGSHFEALFSLLERSRFFTGKNAEDMNVADQINFKTRIHDYGNHQFFCDHKCSDSRTAEHFLDLVLKAIEISPRDQLLLKKAADVSFEDLVLSDQCPALRSGQSLYFESLAMDIVDSEKGFVIAKFHFIEEHFARLCLDLRVSKCNFRRGHFSAQAIARIISVLQGNNIKELTVLAVNYAELSGRPAYSGSRNHDLDIIRQIVDSAPEFSISIMNDSSFHDDLLRLWSYQKSY